MQHVLGVSHHLRGSRDSGSDGSRHALAVPRNRRLAECFALKLNSPQESLHPCPRDGIHRNLEEVHDGKGFGFIENSDGSGDVFVHFSQLTNGGSEDMIVGAEMTFDIEEDPRSGKTKATNVTLQGGGGGGGGYGSYDSGKGKGKGKRYDPY